MPVKKFLVIVAIFATFGLAAACSEGPVEEAGEKVDNLMDKGPAEKAGERADEALDKGAEKTEEAGEKVKEAVD